ncbi:PucR family transcriptional regulator ligand-binding domain-containing protein [Streptomyces sp. ISL-99]|uniref:PucR family transcriptional regulator ligand-binding domain-containing protein n=1 Tax=Streptomyces sp. ISL-99 TaxID=2819193 RepID=UPI00203565A8|nr:PucR family transcriptional regulator ligand-binding domain-containing protein [Streptomyces sp. ISL-99]
MAAALRVRDLVGSPALQLRVLAGEAGLGRPVAWAHVSELEDPTPWLLGAELIMTTGIAIPRSAVRQRAYVERLHTAGVAALVLSAHLHVPPLRQAFLAAAEERGMPVLELPLQVPFIAVAQEVAAAAQADARERLNAQLQLFGALRWLAAEDLTAAELFRRLEQLSGYRLYLCTRHRGPLLPGVPVPDSRHAALLPASPDPAPTVPGGAMSCPYPRRAGPPGISWPWSGGAKGRDRQRDRRDSVSSSTSRPSRHSSSPWSATSVRHCAAKGRRPSPNSYGTPWSRRPRAGIWPGWGSAHKRPSSWPCSTATRTAPWTTPW